MSLTTNKQTNKLQQQQNKKHFWFGESKKKNRILFRIHVTYHKGNSHLELWPKIHIKEYIQLISFDIIYNNFIISQIL